MEFQQMFSKDSMLELMRNHINKDRIWVLRDSWWLQVQFKNLMIVIGTKNLQLKISIQEI